MKTQRRIFDLRNSLLWSLALLTALSFSACSNDDDDKKGEFNEDITGAYILNYGTYSMGGASVTRYDFRNDKVTNEYFENQNPGMTLYSNIQYGAEYNNNIYIVGNVTDELITFDLHFRPTGNAVRTDLEIPRYYVGKGDYLYISCYGNDGYDTDMANSYIAVYSIENRKVEEKIKVPGGPEGLAIVGNKLYASLGFSPKIAVIDLDSHDVDYIDIPSVSSYLQQDKDGNLYATLISTWTDPSESTGLAYINTTEDKLEATYSLDGISTSYGNILSANKDLSTLYVCAASWVEDTPGNWVQKGAIWAFDTESREFEEFASGLTGVQGVCVNPFTNDVYVMLGISAIEAGEVSIYDPSGNLFKTIEVGISPYWILFLE